MPTASKIPVSCHACGAQFTTRAGNAGLQGSCPSCQAPVQVAGSVPKEARQEAPPPPMNVRLPGSTLPEAGKRPRQPLAITPGLVLTVFGGLMAVALALVWLS